MAVLTCSRVEGAANYRRVPLLCEGPPSGQRERFVYGTGMPSAEGLRNALVKMDAGPDGDRKVMWTSLREVRLLIRQS